MSDLQDAILDLCWSAWRELGVRGVLMNHGDVAIDVEPLVLYTPSLAKADPRLISLVFSWCSQHARWVSKVRLQQLFRGAPALVQAEFSTFSAQLTSQGIDWPRLESAASPDGAHRNRTVGLEVSRASLIRLRARALCGVNAKADLWVELLARQRDWLRASDLVETGYSKRNTSRVLADLAESGVLVVRAEGRSLWYRCARPQATIDLLEGGPIRHWPSWTQHLELLHMLVVLSRSAHEKTTVRRVLASQTAQVLGPLVDALWLAPPPRLVEDPNAFDTLIQWGSQHAAHMARGQVWLRGTDPQRPGVLLAAEPDPSVYKGCES